MISAMRKRTISGEQWREIIAEQAASLLSIAAFCRRRRVPEASFYVWRRKLRAATGFAEVKIAAEPGREAAALEPASVSSGIELHLPGQRCVVVRAGFDRRTLLDLLATLERGDRAAAEFVGGAAEPGEAGR